MGKQGQDRVHKIAPRWHDSFTKIVKTRFMEPSFWDVIAIVIPVLAIIFLLIRKADKDGPSSGHNQYKNYRKPRVDEYTD
jgi:hypothetical protein